MFEIGSTLRQARERRRLGLDQVEAETKIRARYLRALEDEQFDLLPGPAYIKGFLRTYAEYLDLDGTLFVDEYNSRFSDPYRDEEVIFPRRRSMPPRDRHHRRDSNVVLIALAGIVAVAVLVAVAFMYPSDRPPASAEVPPTESSISIPTVDEDTIDDPVNPQLPALVEEEERRNAESEAEGTTTAPAAPPRKPVKLVIQATGECWVSVYLGVKGEGDPLYTDTLDPDADNRGRTRAWQARKGFVIELGRPANAEIIVNDKRFTPGTADRIVVLPSGDVQPQA
jgi:cytoskeleton protein RodZ